MDCLSFNSQRAPLCLALFTILVFVSTVVCFVLSFIYHSETLHIVVVVNLILSVSILLAAQLFRLYALSRENGGSSVV